VTAQLSLFALGDRSDRWSVRTSRRARRLSVRVYPGGRVEIVAPQGASPIIVQRFIGEHRQWIDDRVQAFAGLVAPDTRLPTSLDLPAISRHYSIDYVERLGRVRVQVHGEQLVVTGPIADRHAVAVALRRWLCTLAMTELGERLRQVAMQSQLVYSRLQIRRQRTRWGSCSGSGTISLNVCLVFLDPAVVRYLLVHELCHTKQMNHSVRFWSLVASHEPEYRSLDRALLGGWQQVPWWMFG
jgi:predicted metal-dependent hydrolase